MSVSQYRPPKHSRHQTALQACDSKCSNLTAVRVVKVSKLVAQSIHKLSRLV